jgi:hypothetical protein
MPISSRIANVASTPTTSRHFPTDSRALCSISALNGEVFSGKNHFKTYSRWAAPSLPLHAQAELNSLLLENYINPKATRYLLMACFGAWLIIKLVELGVYSELLSSKTPISKPIDLQIYN